MPKVRPGPAYDSGRDHRRLHRTIFHLPKLQSLQFGTEALTKMTIPTDPERFSALVLRSGGKHSRVYRDEGEYRRDNLTVRGEGSVYITDLLLVRFRDIRLGFREEPA